jgi:hypothetical protein
MKKLITLFLITLSILACGNKNKGEVIVPLVPEVTKFCWVILDQNLVVWKTECDKTVAEIATAYPSNNYYRIDEALKCWYEASTNFIIRDFPQSLITKLYPTRVLTIVPCNYCARWYYREKRKYIPNSSITYSTVTVRQFCGDTLQTLYRGREIPLRQSTDSIIVTQFSDNGSNW